MKKASRGKPYRSKEREVYRAALYARRERQLFLRKAWLIGSALAIFAVFLGLRIMTALRSGLLSETTLTASVPEVLPVSSATAEPVFDTEADFSDVLPASPRFAAGEEAFATYHYLLSYSGYSIRASLARSEDAASFFTGYEPLITADTVTLPPNSSDDYVHNAGQSQGSSDGVGAESAESYFSMDDVFLDSDYAVLVDLDAGVIVAGRGADTPVYPASMVKILTLLTASEQTVDPNGSFTITQDIIDTTFTGGLSSVYWEAGETVFYKDMEYGAILPSGADAAIGLARYAAGSEEAFVSLMNSRIAAMHLDDSAHFTNVTGMHDEAMQCTVTDMAMIMKAAMESAHVQEIMKAREYTATATPYHPEGIYMFNMFLDRTDHRQLPGQIICAKTGYTDPALNCAASYFISNSGRHYVCVTAHGHGQMRTVTDHVNLYSMYTK